MYRMPILLSCVALCFSCLTPTAPVAQSANADTLHVVASRLFESRTYEDFLEPLARPAVIQWHNASELSDSALWAALGMADGVLMTGGADIHPGRYGHAADTARCGTIDVERDRIESSLLAAVDSLHMPCLGICRGLQFMNIHNGGTLYAHLPDVLGTDAHRGGVEGDSRDTLHAIQAHAEFLGAPAPALSAVVHTTTKALISWGMGWRLGLMLRTGWLKASVAVTPLPTRATWAFNGIPNGHRQGRPWLSRWDCISLTQCANMNNS